MSHLGDSLTPSSAATATSNTSNPTNTSTTSSPDPISPALTPSLLTPNTREQAEFAFTSNATLQTSSAAPTTSPPPSYPPSLPTASSTSSDSTIKSRRPMIPPTTTSGSNYIAALAKIPVGEKVMVEKLGEGEGKGGVVRGVFRRQGSYKMEDVRRERARVEMERDEEGRDGGMGYSSVQAGGKEGESGV